MKVRISSLEEMEVFAGKFLERIFAREDTATIVLLSGNLGAGKTAFTKCVGRALGVESEITSPTFVIEKRYQTNHAKFRTLIHIDAYRLKGGVELSRLKWEETRMLPHTLIVIEWPEYVQDAIPDPVAAKLSFSFIDEKTREIEDISGIAGQI